MKKIFLTQNKYTFVDDDDYEYLNQFRWWAIKMGNGWRAYGRPYKGKRQNVYLHRFLLNPPINKVIDHINGNPLDNQKSNLRICTHAENIRNSPKQKNNISGYTGVSWYKKNKKWTVNIQLNGRKISGGYFKDINKATQKRKELEKIYFKEFAYAYY